MIGGAHNHLHLLQSDLLNVDLSFVQREVTHETCEHKLISVGVVSRKSNTKICRGVVVSAIVNELQNGIKVQAVGNAYQRDCNIQLLLSVQHIRIGTDCYIAACHFFDI